MNETLTSMGQRIFSLRKKKGLTQEGLANLAGLSYQTISTAELGKKAIDLQIPVTTFLQIEITGISE